MAVVIKCKMCGGDLEITEGLSVAECEYCGSKQTIPSADNEKKMTLFNRASRLLRSCEFDKAAGVFESIIADFPEEAEAYWGLVLCKYGIEYVDDPATGKKVPTCHRSSFESILDDGNFEQACENADVIARKVYRDEAKQIEEIRKGIIAVSANEDPYDIFICYKETAEDGDRTLDSVIAQDIYSALVEKGYRVFFSRITLEDKLGIEYEPYIFAALNSAKVMLAVGTNYEYYNAVWVKNEWSRYLKLMTTDKDKHLIPCFKNIDAYDMPKEFARLQAQDMGKVGAMQDLLRGIEKILTVDNRQSTPNITGSGTAALEIRIYELLAEKDWKRADICCEQLLNLDSQNPHVYIGKLMIELGVSERSMLGDLSKDFKQNENYLKANNYASSQLTQILEGLANRASENYIAAQRKKSEEVAAIAKKGKRIATVVISAMLICVAVFILVTKLIIPSSKYKNAENLFANGDYLAAAGVFEELADFRNSKLCAEESYYAQAKELLRQENYKAAKEIYSSKISDIEKIAELRYIRAEAFVAESRYWEALTEVGSYPSACYGLGKLLMEIGEYSYALDAFEKADSYMDSADLSAELEAKIKQIKVQAYEQFVSPFRITKIGDVLTFGKYEQDGDDIDKEDIEWIVIEKDGDNLQLLSKYILDYRYGDSALISWLNESFVLECFDNQQQEIIENIDERLLLTEAKAKDLREVIDLSAEASAFAVQKLQLSWNRKPDGWWLATKASSLGQTSYIVYVDNAGNIISEGEKENTLKGVRPCIALDLSQKN